MAAYLTMVEECWVDKELHRVTDEDMVFRDEYSLDEYVQVSSKRNLGEKKTIPILKFQKHDHFLIRNGRKFYVLEMKVKT